jgi:ABC-2 type transport system permease protein
MFVPFRTLLRGAFRDRVSLAWAIGFPLVLLLALGFAFPTPGYRRQLLVGMLALSVMFFSLYGIAFDSLAQRNQGVYKLLRATPYRTLTFVVNLTLARGIVALLSSVLVAVVGVLVFRIAVTPTSALLLVPVLALATLCFTFIGLTIGNLSQTETQVAGLNNLVTLPMIFASEAFYSLAAAPDWGAYAEPRVAPQPHPRRRTCGPCRLAVQHRHPAAVRPRLHPAGAGVRRAHVPLGSRRCSAAPERQSSARERVT